MNDRPQPGPQAQKKRLPRFGGLCGGWFVSAIAYFAFTSLVAFADDVVTNVMSPVVSFQYYDALGEDTNAAVSSPVVSYQFYDVLGEDTNSAIVSPVVSYQYFDWLGDENPTFQNSPLVSYYYQFLTSSGSAVLHGQVTDTSGNPIPNAAVEVYVGLSVTTLIKADANGYYQIPSIGSSGVYSILAGASGYQGEMRGLTLNANTAEQDFQLKPRPTTPTLLQVNRSTTVPYTVGDLMGSQLLIFNGTSFVPITANNWPSASLMTIVMTHGWTSDPTVWAQDMAAKMTADGITANIVAWDWHAAANLDLGGSADRTQGQGVGLGEALQYYLGAGYTQPLHFLGHSLGTLLNASAIDYLHGDKPRTRPQTTWKNNLIHVTLFDQAQIADVLGAGIEAPLPLNFTWADNYQSAVGDYGLAGAVNVLLQKGLIINPANVHSYPMDWYAMSILTPLDANNPLGFKRSYEYAPSLFPPWDIQPPSSYHQALFNYDELALEPIPFVYSSLGLFADMELQVAADTGQYTVGVGVQWVDTTQNQIVNGFNYVSGLAEQGWQAVDNFNVGAFNFIFHTTPASSPNLQAKGLAHPLGLPDASSNLQPMLWLPIYFPTNAMAMAFDFTVSGDPVDDALVCGVGTNNLFTMSAKYIPTNQFSSSRLIDVSAWAGTTNELFFGFLGGTSTNATLQVQNIRFYSLQAPQLNIVLTNSTTLLIWPGTAGGYVVESTPSLTAPVWETATNVPVISGGSYILTNYWSDQTRFFRLRQN
ncbi:MAG TPA: carboxypeptidase regulatory-like domain-containing protein [Verrucomicrobiae bacterium]